MSKQDMDVFFTRDRANEGIEIPLYTAGGEKTDHKLRVLGVDSDRFRRAEAESKRDALRIAAINDEEVRAEEITIAKRKLLSSLVCGWSFEKECNQSNVMDFFHNAPQVMDAIDRVASTRALFFGKESNSLQPTPKPSSDSI